MVREHLDVGLHQPLAQRGGNVHWGIVPAQKPLFCCCRHPPFLLQSLHKDAQDNVGSTDSDDQKHRVGEYHPLLIKEWHHHLLYHGVLDFGLDGSGDHFLIQCMDYLASGVWKDSVDHPA
jgi:hypothetical protein